MPFVEIFVSENRTPEQRRDVLVVLSENDACDWSFGNSVAQYATDE